MASIRSFTLPHYDAYPVHVALFTNVTNAAFLRSQLLAANPEFDYALLDASMVRLDGPCCLPLPPNLISYTPPDPLPQSSPLCHFSCPARLPHLPPQDPHSAL
jgi:hypothetical protein